MGSKDDGLRKYENGFGALGFLEMDFFLRGGIASWFRGYRISRGGWGWGEGCILDNVSTHEEALPGRGTHCQAPPHPISEPLVL